jgi:pilus assembly protein Flp/PilA
MKLLQTLQLLLRDPQGATAIEYGLIAGLIAIGIMTAVQGVANETNTMWTRVGTTMAAATAS